MMADVGRAPGVSLLIRFGPEICSDLGQGLRREWLVTNGIGGYGAGTIGGCQTRRYHGLLVAAMLPPVGRMARLVDLDVEAHLFNHRYELACHEYADGTIHPRGHVLFESFRLDGSEIFDAKPPHVPRGCFAQAWSVAEVSRSWMELNRPSAEAAVAARHTSSNTHRSRARSIK